MDKKAKTEELEQKAREDPMEADAMVELGDLYRADGMTQRAINVYIEAAERYSKRDAWQRTAAIYRVILMMSPGELNVRSKLADLYFLLGLLREAQDELITLAKQHERAGNHQARDKVLQRVEDLLQTTASPKTHCSFCGRAEKEVRKLIRREEVCTTGGEVSICNECAIRTFQLLQHLGHVV